MSTARANLQEFRVPRTGRFRRKALLFSFSFAVFALLAGAFVFWITEIHGPLEELQERNRKTLERTPCDVHTCDVSAIANDWEFASSDYVVDKDSNFLLNLDPPEGDFSKFVLNRSDPGFMGQFQSPKSISTPAGETWRLHSATKQLGAKQVEVMVGYAERASWKMDLPVGSMALLDRKLDEQLDRILDSLREEGGKIEVPGTAQRKVTDGYEVVELGSNEIVSGGSWIPVYLPPHSPLPHKGISLYRHERELYLVRTDTSERLIAVSIKSIGDPAFLAVLFGLLFLASGVAAYLSATTFLRRYLVFSQIRPPAIEEAIRLGEGGSIEFKRSISFESDNSVQQLLQTIVAFANSGDGSIFIGIEDQGQLRGISVAGPKGKDRFSQRIHQLVRQHVKPTPLIQVDFIEVRSLIVCRIFVPRGTEPLHFLGGVIYVRFGPTDITAQPEIVRRLLAAYAF